MRHALALSLLLLTLCACATQGVSTYRLPPQTPAADNAAAIQRAAVLASAATQASNVATDQSGARPITAADAPSMYSYDPWARLNRLTYRFNARFDETIFLPVADAYRRTPALVRAGIHNFFDNLSEPKNILNYGLQWRIDSGLRSLGRFVVNSTVGIGGLFDVAGKLDLKNEPTGLSNTLSRWGVHPGPYLVIPILGPSTLRDGVGFLGDFGTSYLINVANLYRGDKSWVLGGVEAIDQRANTDFRYYSSGSPFEYEMVRFLYVHRDQIEDEAQRSHAETKAGGANMPAGR